MSVMKQMLNVVNTNWGLKRAGDWDFTEFSLLPCGDLSIRVFYSRPLEDFEDVDVDMLFPIPVVDTMLQIKEKDLHRINELMDDIVKTPPTDMVDACDGEAWAFTFYDKDGKETYNRRMNYTYGIERLEELQRILSKYIPPHKKPEVGVVMKPLMNTEDIEGLKKQISDTTIAKKDIVVSFMRSFRPDAVAAMSLYDEIAGENVSPRSVCSYSYHGFYWDDRDTMYFERYNIPIDPEFIKLATVDIAEFEVVYYIPEGRIGCVCDKSPSNDDAFIVECYDVSLPVGADGKWTLYNCGRKDIRAIERGTGPTYVKCPVLDKLIENIDCIENRDAVDGNIVEKYLLDGFKEHENWKDQCKNCRWHNY